MQLIQTVTVGSAGQNAIEFNSIPATFTDLVLVVSARSAESGIGSAGRLQVNNTDASSRHLRGNGSSAVSGTNSTLEMVFNGSSSTASVFSSHVVYLPNYLSSTSKSASLDQVSENNGTEAYQRIVAGLYSVTSAITSLKLDIYGNNFVQHSSASLYGILAGSSGGVVVS